MNLTTRARNWLLGGEGGSDDMTLLRKHIIFNTFIPIGITFAIFFGFRNYMAGKVFLTFACLSHIICFAVIYLVHARWHYFKLARNLLVLALGFHFPLYIFLHGANGHQAILWTFFFPICAVELVGAKRGAIASLGYYLLVIPLAYNGIEYWIDGAWRHSDFIRFTAASVCMLLVSSLNRSSFDMAFNMLQKSKTREKSVLESKYQLMTDLSHQLRTPLSVVRLQVEALEHGMEDKVKSCEVLYQKLDILEALLDKIYDSSKDAHSIKEKG